MKEKTATITFHASHNYGSMLQAYALQKILNRLGYDNEIINLRTERQRKLYGRISYAQAFQGLKPLAKVLLALPYIKALQRKYDLFECFLSNSLKLTREYHSLEELEKAGLSYDCFISGGDQIWNTVPLDFDWSFYLPFVREGKRISYAVSMGPRAEEQVSDRQRVADCLSLYNHISVREEGTSALVKSLVRTDVGMDLDPTLLLTGEEWKREIPEKQWDQGDYILLYVPHYKRSVYDMAQYLSRKLGLPVIVTQFFYKAWHYPFRKYLAVGPWEFLDLLQNARLVISGSFHALVFSTLFHVPFWAVDGDKDNRMVTFLKNMSLEDRTINDSDKVNKWNRSMECDFVAADQYLEDNRTRSISHLRQMIEN